MDDRTGEAMRSIAEKKLKQLREELELGQKQLAQLDARGQEIRTTLLRISGAIQVLEEVLKEAPAQVVNGASTVPS